MKTGILQLVLITFSGISLITNQSCSGSKERQLLFPDYPGMKIGFSTQNFLKACPLSAGSINELLLYAADQGFQFIEIRDNEANLTTTECGAIAEFASQQGIEVIYELNLNLLDPNFPSVFEKGLDNAEIFGKPGILRAIITPSGFADDPSRTGWNIEELKKAAIMAEEYAKLAGERGITFIVENLYEPFFGDPPHYYGISDLFEHTQRVGLQYDLCNAFATISRKKADPVRVAAFLGSLGERWVTTHIKTSIEGVAQPVLGDNPLTISEITELMGKSGVTYFALEISGVEEKEACFRNHEKSIEYLVDLGIIEKH